MGLAKICSRMRAFCPESERYITGAVVRMISRRIATVLMHTRFADVSGAAESFARRSAVLVVGRAAFHSTVSGARCWASGNNSMGPTVIGAFSSPVKVGRSSAS